MESLIKFIQEKIFCKYPSFKQFVKYFLAGILNTFTDFFVYFGLTRLIDWFSEYYLIANGISFTLAVTQSFFINKYWTFQDAEKKGVRFQYLKFFIANLFTLSVNMLILYWLVDSMGVYDLYAKFLIIISSIILNFSLFKYWVFRK